MSTRTNAAVPHPAVNIPAAVSIKDNFLEWTRGESWRTPTDRTVIAFSKLADAEDQQIADFAQRHGVLGVFGVSSQHRTGDEIELPDGSLWATNTFGPFPDGNEPLMLWRGLSRRVRAVLRINAALKGRARAPLPAIGLAEDWKALNVDDPLEDFEVNDAQFFLCEEVNYWLSRGHIRIKLGITRWSRRRTDWKLEIGYDGLLGALAYRILLMVAGESRLYSCDGCGQLYIRLKRAPRPGQENFCDDCQAEGVPQLRATQRYRKGRQP